MNDWLIFIGCAAWYIVIGMILATIAARLRLSKNRHDAGFLVFGWGFAVALLAIFFLVVLPVALVFALLGNLYQRLPNVSHTIWKYTGGYVYNKLVNAVWWAAGSPPECNE